MSDDERPEVPPALRRLAAWSWRLLVVLLAAGLVMYLLILLKVIVIPVIVALVLGGIRVKRSVDTWQDADDAVRVAELVQAANKYASDAIDERDV